MIVSRFLFYDCLCQVDRYCNQGLHEFGLQREYQNWNLNMDEILSSAVDDVVFG